MTRAVLVSRISPFIVRDRPPICVMEEYAGKALERRKCIWYLQNGGQSSRSEPANDTTRLLLQRVQRWSGAEEPAMGSGAW